MEFFFEKSKLTLLKAIVQSDSWSAYRQVQRLPSVAQHDMVNHSLNFVDPVTGVHTQNVESYWNRVKTKFKRMKGELHEAMLLDEFMWRERHGTSASCVLANLCRDIISFSTNQKLPNSLWSV